MGKALDVLEILKGIEEEERTLFAEFEAKAKAKREKALASILEPLKAKREAAQAKIVTLSAEVEDLDSQILKLTGEPRKAKGAKGAKGKRLPKAEALKMAEALVEVLKAAPKGGLGTAEINKALEVRGFDLEGRNIKALVESKKLGKVESNGSRGVGAKYWLA